MKKMLAMVGLVAAVSVVCGWDHVTRSIDQLIANTITANSATVTTVVATTLNGTAASTVLSGAAAGATALQGATFAQVDTNATTTTTGYTPAFVGQVLVGGAGTGTNGVWVAKDVTTNGWVQVH